MTKTTKLVITDISEDHRTSFLNLADAMELSRGQLLSLLMVGAGTVNGGLGAAIPGQEAQSEWRDLMVKRTFELINL